MMAGDDPNKSLIHALLKPERGILVGCAHVGMRANQASNNWFSVVLSEHFQILRTHRTAQHVHAH